MLIDVWNLIKSYVPPKDKSVVANKFVDIVCDNGIEDEELHELMGHDEELDEAIKETIEADADIIDDYGDGFGDDSYEDY